MLGNFVIIYLCLSFYATFLSPAFCLSSVSYIKLNVAVKKKQYCAKYD